ncbi:MAG: DUF882 domain-containing protein [Deltaproteobacteria bacterium]|nr:DUF882 domain-containing protein [Deltaproteobacteria bacterium]
MEGEITGRILGALLLAAAAFPGLARAGDDEVCDSAADPMAGLSDEEEVTRPAVRPPKRDKVYPGSPDARRGYENIATTIFSVHEREGVPIFEKGTLPIAALESLFRCRGFGERHTIDARLVETVLAAAAEFKARRVNVVSAYRSPKLNDALAKKGRRVAAESRHTQGEAIDFNLPDVPAARLGAWLWDHFEGGVGVYVRDDFVHIDVGPRRRWKGR